MLQTWEVKILVSFCEKPAALLLQADVFQAQTYVWSNQVAGFCKQPVEASAVYLLSGCSCTHFLPSTLWGKNENKNLFFIWMKTSSQCHTSQSLVWGKNARQSVCVRVHVRVCVCVCVCVCVHLMSGYLDTSVETSRNSSVGSVSLNTSAMAAMAPHSRSVSSPCTQQTNQLRCADGLKLTFWTHKMSGRLKI